MDQSERQKLKALEIAKHRVLSDFHTIGLKEHIEWSLVLLEYMLPYYFKSGLKEYNGQGAVRDAMQASATMNKKQMTPEAEQFMAQGPLQNVILWENRFSKLKVRFPRRLDSIRIFLTFSVTFFHALKSSSTNSQNPCSSKN